MRQVLYRALALLRRPFVIAVMLILVAGGVALCFVPLFGVPGYELGEALALAVGVLGGGVGVAAAFQERRLIQGRDPRPARALRIDGALSASAVALFTALLLLVVALVPPFVTALFRAIFTTQCNPLAHIGFFPLLTLPSALIASATGVLIGFSVRTWWMALLSWVLVLLASVVVTAWPIYFGPQVFAFNHFGGYFPGPLYDEALFLTPAVYAFRLQTVLIAAAAWLFTAFCLDMKEGRVRRPHFRPASAFLLAAVVAAVVGIEQQGPVLGLRTTNAWLAGKLGGLRTSEHFRIHYYRGKDKESLDRLERDLEFRFDQLRAFLGDAPKEPIDVYVYRSAAEKKQLVGAGGTQFAKPWQRALHINDAPFPHPVMKHELLHVMAAPFGSGPFHITARGAVLAQMAIVEGMAVAGDNHVDDLTLHQWAAAMRRRKLAPNVRDLFQPSGFYGAAANRAYTIAGSFLRFLADTRGTDKLRKLYFSGDFTAAYGKSLDELATEWERFIDAVPLDARAEAAAWRRFRRPSLFSRPCAREVATLEQAAGEFLASDPDEALALYQRCSRLQPDEPAFVLGEARALTRLDRMPEAEEVLAHLASKLSDQPSVATDVEMARGDIAWRAGKEDRARKHYEEILAHDPEPAQDRAARVKLAALGRPVLDAPIRAWFEEGADDVKLYLLREAVDRAPDDPYLHYLIGRRLTQSGAPRLALEHLQAALAHPLPESIHNEALRLQIEAEYLAGDCDRVREIVNVLPDFGAAFALWAREWVDRCDFEDRVYKGPLVPEGPFR
ncbi:MAG: hypothetical protein IRZ16_11915 [Myxococcaceae bacterium]|nr:hypothetical protein [Myxococcaceae bacterium]